MGKPGFPIPLRIRAGGPRTQAPAHGRVWEDAAFPGRNCSPLGQPTRLGARASRPRRVYAGKLPALPGDM